MSTEANVLNRCVGSAAATSITSLRLQTARFLVALGFTSLCLSGLAAGSGYGAVCDVCGQAVGDANISVEDKVTKSRKRVCEKCALHLPRCSLCGVPALTNVPGAVQFEDGRILCARDAKSSVTREEDGLRICAEVREQLQRQFSRFMQLPLTNVTFATVDRLHLEDLYKIVGHDYACPNTNGITMTRTNQGRQEYEISVLLGIPESEFGATCAHECGLAWQNDNLSEARRKRLSEPSREGFCELVAFLYADAHQDEVTKRAILTNAYTRGQAAAFIEAEKTYGFNDILEWMKYGLDDHLKADELLRVRALEVPSESRRTGTVAVAAAGPAPVRTYETLALKAILWDARRPAAIINDKTFAPGEEATLLISRTNVAVHCIEIRKDAVRIRLVSTGEEKTLEMGKGR